MSYAFSDGAASSDTEASLVFSHSSDTDFESGPFTPLTPSHPAGGHASVGMTSTNSAGAASASARRAPGTSTSNLSRPPMPTSCPIGSGSDGGSPWRPRELHLVGRRQRETSAGAAGLFADLASSGDLRRSPVPAASSGSRFAPSTERLGLGIQLPSLHAAGSEASAALLATEPTRSDGGTASQRHIASTSATATADPPKRKAGAPGLKTLALAPASGLESLPRTASPIAWLTDRVLDGSDGDADPIQHGTKGEASAGWPVIPFGRSRSRQASSDSPLLEVATAFPGPSRTPPPKPPLPVLPRTPVFAEDATPSWAREQEEKASINIQGLKTTTDQSVMGSGEAARSHTPTRDESGAASEAHSNGPVNTDVAARDEIYGRERSSSTASASGTSRRRKGPPAPLILLPNGRTPSMASSGGQRSAQLLESASAEPIPSSPTSGDETAAQVPKKTDRLAVLRKVETALPSPAMSEFNESFQTPTFSPATEDPPRPFLMGSSTRRTPEKGAFATGRRPSAMQQDPIVSRDEAHDEVRPSLRISLPLRTPYFDSESKDSEDSSPSDYGDGKSSHGSLHGDSQPPSAVERAELPKSRAAPSREDIPLIFRKMTNGTHASSVRKPAPSSADVDHESVPSNDTRSGSTNSSYDMTLPTIASASSVYTNDHHLDGKRDSAAPISSTAPPSTSASLSSLPVASGIRSDAAQLLTGLTLPVQPLASPSVSLGHADSARFETSVDAFEFDAISDTQEGDLSVIAQVARDQEGPNALATAKATPPPSLRRGSDVNDAETGSSSVVSREAAVRVGRTSRSEYNEQDGVVTGPSSPDSMHRCNAPLLATSVSQNSVATDTFTSSTSAGSMLGEIIQFPSVPSDSATLSRQSLSADSSARLPPSSPASKRARGLDGGRSRLSSLAEDTAGHVSVPTDESSRRHLRETDGPMFNTDIFRSPSTPRGLDDEDEMVDPMEVARSTSSDQPGTRDFAGAGPVPSTHRPWSKLYMQPLPSRSLTSSAMPQSVSVVAVERPKLWLQTSDIHPAPQAQMMQNAALERSSNHRAGAMGPPSLAKSAMQRFDGGLRSSPLYGQEPLTNMGVRSAPLPQGAFTPQSQESPILPQQPSLARWDMDCYGTGGLTSHFSSGSESEGESRSTKRNSKGRRSVTSKSRASSVAPTGRDSMSAAAHLPPSPVIATGMQFPKGKGFFQSLGLKKKSLPNITGLRDAQTNAASLPSTPGVDSPVINRVDTAAGFPFPGMAAGSLKETNRMMPPPRPADAASRSLGVNAHRKVPSSAALSQGKDRSGGPAVPEAVSGHRPSLSVDEYGVLQTSAPSSPRKERFSSLGAGRRSSKGIEAMSRYLPTRSTARSSKTIIPERLPPTAGRASVVAIAGATNTSSTIVETEGTDLQTPVEGPSVVTDARPLYRHSKSASKQLGSGSESSRGQALASRQTDSSQLQPDRNDASAADVPSSTQTTPRLTHLSLDPATSPRKRASAMKPQVKRPGQAYGRDAFSTIGQEFIDSIKSPSPSEERVDPIALAGSRLEGTYHAKQMDPDSLHTHRQGRLPRRLAKRRKMARLLRNQGILARHPSLTDEGRQYVRDHPSEAFALLHGTPHITQASQGGRNGHSEQPTGQRESRSERSHQTSGEGSEDDYGQYEGSGARGNGSAAPGGGSGGGRRGDESDDGSDDDDDELYGSADKDGGDTDVSTSDSEDDYGEADPTPQGDDASDDSDDRPLGQQVNDVALLQRRLQSQAKQRQPRTLAGTADPRSSRSGARRNLEMATAGAQSRRAERVPASGVDGPELNAQALSDRLQRMQIRQREYDSRKTSDPTLTSSGRHAEPAQGGQASQSLQMGRSHTLTQPGSSTENGSRADKISRARSMANRAGPRLRANAVEDDAARMPASRPRRSSDAAQKPTSAFVMPPLSAMPSNDSAKAAVSPTAGNNTAVTQAAIIVATQAAREGRIPTSAIPLQAQALAVQAMAAQNGPNNAALGTLERAHSKAASHRAKTSQGEAPSPRDAALTSTDLARVSSAPGQGIERYPRSLAVDTRAPAAGNAVNVGGTLGSAITSASPETLASAGREETPLSYHTTLSRAGTHRSSRSARRQPDSPALPVRLQAHRVYIVTRQRYSQCEVPALARARDLVLDVIDRETVQPIPGRGGWTLFDVSPTYGIERPLREYELISDITAARPDDTSDFFLLKQTELAPYASIRAVPSFSPALAGWVYIRDKRGKWSKRWLELREHSLFHAKSDKGKEEVFICHLSVFDVYLAEGPVVKAPKAHTFAVRSQNAVTMFEDKEDFIHYFCLSDPSAHRDWIRAIMNARTYVMKQENAILFSSFGPPAARASASGSHRQPVNGAHHDDGPQHTFGASLSRRGTVKRPSESISLGSEGDDQPRHSPLLPRDAFAGPFEKGSLLASEAQRDASNGHPGSSRPVDLSMHERTRARLEEERRRAEVAERQRKAKQEGKPLISMGSAFNKF
ncbi:unnamed protein product [Parajaminaea phylloscopi]